MVFHSSNALWLISALPVWYFSAVSHPLQAGMWSFIPFLGTLGLVVGIFMGFFRRGRASYLFFLPFLLNEVFVAVAGFFRGRLRGNARLLPACLFIIAQIALTVCVAYRTRQARSASLALSVFSLSYSLIALLVAGMSFADSWL